ncbi:MAG: PSD1 domain-containing protein [Verrucomicrobiales bacterium]|nr:PSD1 domain-containing protein [Verrucomicrobiales bacterium]
MRFDLLSFVVALGGAIGVGVGVGLGPGSASLQAAESGSAASVDFARDIRPLFESRCHSCHGSEKQRADLRLDRRASAVKGGESGPAWEAGRAEASLLVKLISGGDPDRLMPPKGERLSDAQVALVRAWIDQGATWPEDAGQPPEDPLSHWSFQPVRRPVPPVTTLPAGGNPVDAFIVERLAGSGLTLSGPAPRETQLRRLYLVLFGLAPSPEEVAQFVGDPDPNAFEQWVDRALEDRRYGERWGRHWLDIVRFAESNGFETNRERLSAWRYRDYVIDAFHRDLPFDRFIQEQIAGDVLGNDVATGFLVGGPVDIVGSPDPVLTAQQRADELDDMINTTGTAFLGLTLGCARCHNHKFDPVEQREYYSLAAVFAGVRHGERALPMPPEAAAKLAACENQIAELQRQLEPFVAKAPTSNQVVAGSVRREAVNARLNVEQWGKPLEARWVRFTIEASSGGEPCLDELEVYAGERNVALASAGTRVTASGTLPGFEIHRLDHVNDGRTGNSRSWISHESGRGWVQLEFPRPELIDRVVWSRDREGQYGDRVPTRYRIEVAVEPGAWRLAASSEDRVPFEGGAGKPSGPPPVRYVFEGHSETVAAEARRWVASLEELKKQRETLAKPPQAYSGKFEKPSTMHRLHRGDPMQKREPVAPSTLAVFRPVTMTDDEPESERRLKLARWVADPANPLTPRVLVNRLWQYHFGVGLVDTPSDFGRSGSRPTHPELLDWLASEFVESGWSMKAVQRRILLSATWRQSSEPRSEALRVDASSRLVWRFPPRRLEAEAIRDRILQASGDLDLTPGGPSFYLHEVDRENVYHYHPKDRFAAPEHRRMVYAFKVRMEQDGIFGSFDCPDGSLAMSRRGASTTPLQALNLFNSEFILQQSASFARRLEREAGTKREAQIQRAWVLALGRSARDAEVADAARLAEAHGLEALTRALLNSNEFLFIP